MKHIIGILGSPLQEWARIRDANSSVAGHYLGFLLWIALLPPLAWWFGASQIGWQIDDRTVVLTPGSAAQIMALFYVAILCCVAFLGYMIYWMAKTTMPATMTWPMASALPPTCAHRCFWWG